MASASQKLLTIGTKIVGVGRNYAAHAKELGNAVPKEPVLFLKPTTSYLANGGTIEIPRQLESLDHEVELAVLIGKKARDVAESDAMDFVGGYALALDMTAREIQSSAKAAGLQWTLAKAQDTFTPISAVLPKSMVLDHDNVELWLKVDEEIRQKGSTKDMIFKIPFLISHISSLMTLLEGDVILTGTPPGVGSVRAGQKITAGSSCTAVDMVKPSSFCIDDTVVVKFVGSAIEGKSEAEAACHHGLVDPTVNMKEAMNAISCMFRGAAGRTYG